MDNQVSLKMIASIKRHEGYRKFVYADTRGVPTIAFGRNLRDVGISESEADILLHNDIANAQMELYRFIPWAKSLDDVRKAALIELVFNMGIESLLGFKNMLHALQDGNYKIAAQDLLNSRYAGQVGTRAHDIAYSIETGIL